MSVIMVLLGKAKLTFKTSELEELEDCNHLLGNRELLLQHLHDKGYVDFLFLFY